MISHTGRRLRQVKAVIDKQPSEAEQIKSVYRAGAINFVEAVYELRKARHTQAEAQKLVDKWIREKHNNEDHTR